MACVTRQLYLRTMLSGSHFFFIETITDCPFELLFFSAVSFNIRFLKVNITIDTTFVDIAAVFNI